MRDCLAFARMRRILSAHASLRDMIAGPWRAVSVLGITQIIAWGTIFYSPVLTAPLIVRRNRLVAVLRHGRLFARPADRRPGLAVRRPLDRPLRRPCGDERPARWSQRAGPARPRAGARLRRPISRSGWCSARASARSLYDPAFATLGRIFGAAARRPITILTLAGGFASTAGWPATHVLIDDGRLARHLHRLCRADGAGLRAALCLRAAAQPRRLDAPQRQRRRRRRPRCCRRAASPSCW